MPTIEQLAQKLVSMSPSFQAKVSKTLKQSLNTVPTSTPPAKGYVETQINLQNTLPKKVTKKDLILIKREARNAATVLRRNEKMQAQFERSSAREARRAAIASRPRSAQQLRYDAVRIYAQGEAQRIIKEIMDAEASSMIKALRGDSRVIYFALKEAQRSGIYIPFLYDAKNDPFFERTRLAAQAVLLRDSVDTLQAELNALSPTEIAQMRRLAQQILTSPLGEPILKAISACGLNAVPSTNSKGRI